MYHLQNEYHTMQEEDLSSPLVADTLNSVMACGESSGQVKLVDTGHKSEAPDRGVGTGPADPAAAGPMSEPAFMIQLKNLPAILVKFSYHS